eukprot:3836048-Heterocapsa_arctica.AAC.1
MVCLPIGFASARSFLAVEILLAMSIACVESAPRASDTAAKAAWSLAMSTDSSGSGGSSWVLGRP